MCFVLLSDGLLANAWAEAWSVLSRTGPHIWHYGAVCNHGLHVDGDRDVHRMQAPQQAMWQWRSAVRQLQEQPCADCCTILSW